MVRTEILRIDPALDAVVPPGATIEKIAAGFLFTEGPLWVPRTATTDGYLLFSDPNANAIYRWSPDGQVSVFRTKSGYTGADIGEYAQPGPNGIAFSPDEKYLYIGNWDPSRKVVMRYEVRDDGMLANGRVFFDMTSAPGEDALDGIKVDRRGNLYVSGPGGLWILSPEGKHLGTIRGPEHPHNMAWGDDDGRTLYLAAQTGVYRIRLAVTGVRP